MKTNYTYSKDYSRLADMVEAGERVLCYVIVDGAANYQVPASVRFVVDPLNESLGHYDVWAFDRIFCMEETRPAFISECKRLNVEYPEPNK